MQQVIRGTGPVCVRFSIVLAVLVLMSSCSWKNTMGFPAPSGRVAIEIWQPWIDNSMGLRIELVSNGRRQLLYHSPNDAIVYFAHVYWSTDEKIVGILATGTGNWQLAFDTNTGKSIPFEQIRNDFGQSITATYHVPRGEDPVSWATSSEAQSAFFKLHPEIRLSYH